MDTERGDRVGRALGIASSRRSALRSVAAGALSAVAALDARPLGTPSLAGGRAISLRQPDTRPNIILILLDDMRADDLEKMQSVQELLVAEGTNFTNFFAAAPACAAARASILRGQHQHNLATINGYASFYRGGFEQSTVATWLQEAGYRTALLGKYINDYPQGSVRLNDVPETYVPPGWDDWVGAIDDAYFKMVVNENGHVRQYKKQYGTDVLAAKALAFVAQMTQRAEPYFLYLAPKAPHGPLEYPPRHATAFAGLTAPRPPSFNEADVSDNPAWVQAIPTLDAEQVAALDADYVNRLRTLLAVDEMVAGLVEELRSAGTLDKTYIVLTSDNGYQLGEHRTREKRTAYEESIRIPLVVRGPTVPAGQTITALTSQVDLAPTFAAWADAAVPAFVDGRSLVPLRAREETPTWRQIALVELRPEENPARKELSTERPGFNALRAEDFIYVEYSTGELELYDLVQDPYQLHNLAASVDTARIQALSERLTAMATCAGSACREIEEAPLPRQ